MARRLIAVLLASLLLTGCLVTPGKFTSELAIDKKGRFDFTYQGEISILGFSKLLDMAAASETENDNDLCFDEDYADRPCSEQEIAERKAEKVRENAEQAEMLKALLGGIDPSSPQAIETFIERVSRQKGWNSIVHKEDGVFDVDFSISGQADQGFTFPLMEKLQGVTPFVTIVARKDGKVRIEAPGFAKSDEAGGFTGSLSMLASLGMAGNSSDVPPQLTLPNGTFTVRTAGSILTNNTDEGPAIENGESVLRWDVTTATSQAPETLIGLE